MPRGQQKVRLSKSNLPEVSRLSDGRYGYVVRYRIISEDQNRFSHWSPIRELAIPDVSRVNGDIAVTGSIVQVVWEESADASVYDIFVKFDGGDYEYKTTTQTTQYSLVIPYDVMFVQVLVQVASIEKEKAEFLEIFESIETSLVELS